MSFPIPAGLWIGRTVRALLSARAHTATFYLSPTEVIRATRKLVDGQIPTGRLSRVEVALTLGRPNYRAVRFIKLAKRVGETFPIDKVQLTFPPRRRATKVGKGRRR